MKKTFVAALCVIWSFTLFGAGYLYHAYRLLHSGSFVTTQPLILSNTASSNEGTLPAGATLYHYRYFGEQAIFVAFIGTKRLDILQPQQPQQPQNWLEMSPVTAW
jgi:hypothetical protein